MKMAGSNEVPFVETPQERERRLKAEAAAPQKPSWIAETGVESSLDDPDRIDNSQKNLRFWMAAGTQKKIIFLSDGSGPYGPPAIFEHQYPRGTGSGRFLNWETCVEPLGVPCPMCAYSARNNGVAARYKALFFTVIDLTEWVSKKTGQVHRNEKKFLVAKNDVREILARRYATRLDNGETLRGAMFNVLRSSKDKSPSVGSDFEFIKMVNLQQLVDTGEIADAELLDAYNLLAPNPERMTKIVRSMSLELTDTTPNKGPEGTTTQVQY
jgi:hypothetical protein